LCCGVGSLNILDHRAPQALYPWGTTMPVRSVKLKLIIPRGPAATSTRLALWTTHAEVNAATSYYERQLLVMRALPYEVPDPDAIGDKHQITLGEAEAQLLAVSREAQRRNRRRLGLAELTPGTDTEILAAVRALYGHLVPDETGAASAQAANGYLSPLTDPESRGYGAAADKLDRARPNWLGMSDGDPTFLDAANAWFASDASAAWRGDTGAPSAWLRAAAVGDASWPRLFRRKLDDLTRAATEGAEGVIARLRSLNLLPFFDPYFPPRLATARAVTPWDRLAFRLAVAHLLSWQAWVRRAAEQHAQRRQALDDYRSRAVTPEMEALLARVRAYEVTRTAALSQLGLGESVYTFHPRQLRGWQDLRDAWRKLPSPSSEQLREIAATQQTRRRGRFGDPQVFLWLADPEQHMLWVEEDVPTVAANLNVMQALIDRSRETATMTLPDARLHPRAVQWAAEGDTNIRPYRLRQTATDGLMTDLSLLHRPSSDGKLHETRMAFRLAPSAQFRTTEFGSQNGKARVTFSNGAGETFLATVGSSDLLFDRHHLSRRQTVAIGAGDIGPVWLKLALDIDTQRPSAWTQGHGRFTRHFSAALGKPTKLEGDIQPGVRVLAVDLGVRTFATCAVFELHAHPPPHGAFAFPVPIQDRQMWAVHERSFHLDLPDEQPGKAGLTWRRGQRAELQRIRRAFSTYRRITRLGSASVQDRLPVLEELQAAIVADDSFPFMLDLHTALASRCEAPQPVWADSVATTLGRFRQHLGPIIRHWRRAGRVRQDFNHLGKSMWSIEYLTDLRRALQSWSLLGRASGEIRRLARAGRGTFAAGLLEHLNNIKEDRLKTGSDLIIRAALGYVRDGAGRWEQRYAPCNAVLFEDLTRYRMRTDRPRRENSQLMRWAHRAVPAEVGMQGALYEIAVTETAAAFSSRYHARTLTPGVRCKALTAADLGNIYLREDLAQDGFDLGQCHPGDLVPWRGGDTFVCVRRGERLLQADADINAAQNLQRRYWTRHADAFRLPCVPVTLDGALVWRPRQMGKRLAGALGGMGVLRPTGHDSGSCRWERVTPRKLRDAGEVTPDTTDAGLDEAADELMALAEDAEATTGKVEVFFRDPSGVLLPANLWFPAKPFWGIVQVRTQGLLKARLLPPKAAR
jgi:hypothetical protein